MTGFEIIALVLFVLWLGGYFLVPLAVGPAVHLLLLVVLILVVIRLLQGGRVL